MLNEEVNDQDLNLNVQDETETEEKSDEKSDTWKDKQKVPYRRLEAQSRKNQQLETELNELKSKFEALTKTETKTGKWDDRIKNAQSWDEVFNELPNQFLETLLKNPEMKAQFVSSIKNDLKNEEKQVEEKVNQEIDNLWDKEIVTSKDQENRLIKYAIKESEESGEYIPLAVAVRMMKKEGVWDKKIEDRKEANSKVRPAGSSNNNSTQEKSSYNRFRNTSMDSIVADAVSKFDK
jgi:hypothetical protein